MSRLGRCLSELNRLGWTLAFRDDGPRIARMGGGGYCGLAGPPR